MYTELYIKHMNVQKLCGCRQLLIKSVLYFLNDKLNSNVLLENASYPMIDASNFVLILIAGMCRFKEKR